MKLTTPHRPAIGLAFALAALLARSALGQGALTPPGAPAPTMKSLDQVEARTIVSATNTPGNATNTFIISAPGSYYLTGNITGAAGKHGINILANDVTLDLNGFALISGGGGVLRGVSVPAPLSGICVRNGSVRGWSGGGVRADFAVTVADCLRLSDNVGGIGLAVGNGSIVTNCVASGNGTGFSLPDRTQISNCISTVNSGDGFSCTSYVNLIDCTASRNGGNGILTLDNCSIVRCSATRNLPGGRGINARDGCNIVDCNAGANGLDGIMVSSGGIVRGCTSRANGGTGVLAFNNCHLFDNACEANHTGIAVNANGNRVEGNTCNANTNSGFLAYGANLIIRNSAHGNGTNYEMGSGNAVGVILDVTAGGTVSVSSPWTNFVN